MQWMTEVCAFNLFRDQCAPSVENPAVSQLKLKKSQRKRFSAVTTAQKAREKKVGCVWVVCCNK